MVVGSPIRTLISALASQGSGGRTIAENVQRMQAEGTRFGAADIERGRALVETEQRTAMQSAEEKRLNALNDGTNAVVRFSNALDDFSKSSPILSTALQTGGGLVSGVLGSAMINRLGASAAGGTGLAARAVQALTGVGGEAAAVTAGGQAAGAGGAAAGAGGALPLIVGAASLVAGGGIGTLINRAIYSDRTGMQGSQVTSTARGQAAYTNIFSGDAWRGFATSVAQAVRDGLSEAPITATVSPVDATHAATTAAPRR